MKCEQADQSAPRVGCDCRECYRMRERALDPRLIDLFPRFEISPHGPARHIVHRLVTFYLMGKIEWAALQPMIIEELVKLADEQFKRELDRTRMELPPRFIVKKDDLDPFGRTIFK